MLLALSIAGCAGRGRGLWRAYWRPVQRCPRLKHCAQAFLSCLHYCESWPHLNKVSSPFTPQVRLFTWFFVGNRPGEGEGVTQFRSAPSAVEDFVVTFRAVDGSESFVHLGVQLRGCWRRQRWPSFVCLFVGTVLARVAPVRGSASTGPSCSMVAQLACAPLPSPSTFLAPHPAPTRPASCSLLAHAH